MDGSQQRKSFRLAPEKAVHIPVNAPHWVKNDANVSVSISMNFAWKDESLFQSVPSQLFLEENGNSAEPAGTLQPPRWHETRSDGVWFRASKEFCAQHSEVPEAPQGHPSTPGLMSERSGSKSVRFKAAQSRGSSRSGFRALPTGSARLCATAHSPDASRSHSQETLRDLPREMVYQTLLAVEGAVR